MRATKLIVTATATLKAKYGSQTTTIKKLLNQLKKADKARNIDSRIVYIDELNSTRSAGVKAVKKITEVDCKKIIDDLYKKHLPDYIVIVGAQDVFPFITLNNPASEDDDKTVPSDLPYACDAAYSKNVQDFVGPTRVVSRLPDIPNKKDTAYFSTLIKNSIQNKPRKKEDFMKYFAVSAKVWQKSTAQSVLNIFGDNRDLLLSPGASAQYTAAQLKKLMHFYNCHGAASDLNFYGQQGKQYPIALTSNQLNNKISAGTLVTAECCYGAELVNPALLENPSALSIANTYLGNNAVAFMGSSNIAYGPSDGQGLADLICQYFFKNVLAQASTGRALLQARQQFLNEAGPHLDPYELKTVAQFNLLGDPSITPVLDDTPKKIIAQDTVQNTRLKLSKKGTALSHTLAPCRKEKTVTRSANQKQINTLLQQTGFNNYDKKGLYKTRQAVKPHTEIASKMVPVVAQFRTFVKTITTPKSVDFSNTKVLVIKEAANQVLGWRIYEQK